MEGAQVVDQMAGVQMVDQLAGVQVVVDLVAGTQVHYGSRGRNRSDGCSDPDVIQTDIGLVCDISTLSDNQKVEHMLNHFEVVCSTGVANRARVASVFRMKGVGLAN